MSADLANTEQSSTTGQEKIPSSQRNLKEEDEKIAVVNAEGKKIYADFLNRLHSDKQFYQLDPQSKYDYYMKLYPDFARSNPLILRYITLGMFSEKANFLYFKQCYMYVTKTDEDFCNRQADLVKYIYTFNTKIRGAALEKIWSDTKTLLMAELEEIAVERKRMQDERASRKVENNQVRVDAIKVAITKAIANAKARVLAESLHSQSDKNADAPADAPADPTKPS